MVRIALVARVIEALDEAVARQAVADGEVDAVFVEVGLRAEALAQRGGARDNGAVGARRQFGQDAQAFGDEVGMRRVLVIRQGFPVAEPVKRGGVGQPVFEVFVPVFAGTRVGGDEELDVFAVGAAGEVVGEEGEVHGGVGNVIYIQVSRYGVCKWGCWVTRQPNLRADVFSVALRGFVLL